MSETIRIDRGDLYSRAVVHGGLVYLMGHVSDDKFVDIKIQTQQILARIDETLTLAGTVKSNLLSVTIWLADTRDYAAMNEIWRKWVAPNCQPARSTAGASLISPGRKIVISGIASIQTAIP